MKFKNKFRAESHRKSHWDYGGNGGYYITINTNNRIRYFGDIKYRDCWDGNRETQRQDSQVWLNAQIGYPYVELSEIGSIVKAFWMEIPNHFPHVTLDEYIIMPDHVHGILLFDSRGTETLVNTPNLGVSTKASPTISSSPASPLAPHNLGIVINQYKRICTIHIRKKHPGFKWLNNYHDRVIRDEMELNRIRAYIKNNPWKWIR